MDRNLVDLPDDCLIQIFQNLTVAELSSVASTCNRFKTIARDVFPSVHKSNCLEIDINSVARRRQASSILQNFGDLVTTVKVIFYHKNHPNFYNISVYNLMLKYCTGTLNKLELNNCKILQPGKIADATALFRNTKELVVYNSPAIDSSFLSAAPELTRLSLNGFLPTRAVTFLANQYPQLEALTLNNSEDWKWDIMNINDFLKRQPRLIELKLEGGGFYDMSKIHEWRQLRKLSFFIGNKCSVQGIAELDQLTSLELTHGFRFFEHSPLPFLNQLRSTQSLENLVLIGSSQTRTDAMDDSRKTGEQLMNTLERFPNLKYLSIKVFGYFTDDLIPRFQHLQKLRVLSISWFQPGISSDGLINLVRQLPDLEQLALHRPTSRDNRRLELMESTYLRICEIYQNRNQKLVIYNFDASEDKFKKVKRKQPFAECNQQRYVQYIALDKENDNFIGV